jgi:hypothetical protein
LDFAPRHRRRRVAGGGNGRLLLCRRKHGGATTSAGLAAEHPADNDAEKRPGDCEDERFGFHEVE